MTDMVSYHAVSVAAVIGLLVIVWHLWKSDDTSFAHLRRLLLTTAVFYVARSLHWLIQIDTLRTITILVVALLPLMILLVVEQFMRRHAPFYIKLIVAVGMCLFVVVSFNGSINTTDEFVHALLVFQLFSIGLILWFIAQRDQSSLNAEENQTIGRIGFVLVIVVPLLISDYQLSYYPLPINLSGLGVIIGCWVLVHMYDKMFNRTRIVFELVVFLAFALSASVFVSWYAKLDSSQWVQVWVILIAFTLSAATIVGVFHLRWRKGPIGNITRGLLQEDSLQAYLASLNQRDAGFMILKPGDLEEFDKALLLEAFDVANGSINANDLPLMSNNDDMMQSQIRNLLLQFSANQLYLVAKEPLHLAVVQRRGLTDAPDNELFAAFSLARLIAERDCLRKAQSMDER